MSPELEKLRQAILDAVRSFPGDTSIQITTDHGNCSVKKTKITT